MANSLMELYGGGMVGKSNNYQLGGRIAGARRAREYQGEMRELERKQREAAKRQRKASGLGNVLSKVGAVAGAFIPGVGTAIGSGIGAGLGRMLGESTYKSTDFGEGKYAKQSRSDLQGMSEDFKKSIGERALGEGVTTAVGAYFKPKAIEGMQDFIAREGLFGKSIDPGGRFAKKVTEQGLKDNPWLDQTDAEFWDEVPFAAPERPVTSGIPKLGLSELTFPSVDDVNIPELQQGIFDLRPSLADISMEDMMIYGRNPIGPLSPAMMAMRANPRAYKKGGGLVDYLRPKMQAGGNVNPYGYGTAIDPQAALKQMGMGTVAADPRLQQYLGDLPSFQMGYAQQVGDYRTGAQQGLLGLAQAGASGAGGFAGSGAATTQSQQQRQQMVDQFGRQRRGVVESYQADLLSAIGDIERKGEFEFASGKTPWETLGITEEEYNRRTEAERQRLLSQAGNVGILNPTQGTGTTTTTGGGATQTGSTGGL